MPEWVHLLPAGEIRTVDGRGPYRASLQSVIAASLAEGRKLPIDECHVTDKGAALGLAAPARGWIVELQSREDGLWGRVEWNASGRQLMEDKAYAGLSPVILHSQGGDVLQVLRASLTNTPNLQGLVALHSEGQGMDWKAKLIELLGLDSSADDAAIEAALAAKIEAAKSGAEGDKTALCAADVLALPAVKALQSEVADLTGQLNSLRDDRSRSAAVTFVDAAIAEGRAGLKPMRDEYIALHMQDAARAEKLIGAMPRLSGASVTAGFSPEQGGGGLDATDRQVMALFGVDEDAYAAGLTGRGHKKEAI